MDFVMKLPRTSSRHDAVWVIVDRLTKSAHFLPMREDYKMDRLAKIYLNEIIARQGLAINARGTRNLVRHKKAMQTKRRKNLEFNVGEYVLFKVSPWKGMVRFGKKGKLAPRSVWLTQDYIPLDEIQVDTKLNFVEDPVEILE
ncbi:retrotransposon protein, putative, ty3-gypsy subclass [Tanacetum coccineum]|uniref:Retrotransposon protein, putative, ty3-gypsy subclass n=1 Tax=Tanacetum coccineum TaxID=301880 RepID=A0ABQ4WT51_9ASTR